MGQASESLDFSPARWTVGSSPWAWGLVGPKVWIYPASPVPFFLVRTVAVCDRAVSSRSDRTVAVACAGSVGAVWDKLVNR